jgi:nicotinamidase/pyrazinamidase
MTEPAKRRFGTSAAAPVDAAVSTGAAFAQTRVRADAGSVLIVVDVQNCFMPGGSLAVPDGDDVVPVINRLARLFRNVVLTQDWHHPQHVSFASQHHDKNPFDQIVLPYGSQVLWPDHCV